MTQEQEALISRMRAVTISREYGSGGGEIASRLATRLGWYLIDHEIVVRVAQELHISVEEAEEYDERGESTVSQILNSMGTIYPTMFTFVNEPVVPDSKMYREALSRVVNAAVATRHAVIVGRGAQVLLKDWRDVLHVRIIAPLEKRIVYVMQREKLDREQARSRISLKDHDRMRYLQTEYNQRPDNALLYDLVVNTSILELDSAVDLIVLALARKAERIAASTGELGPAAGVPPYPGHPGDFRPPEQ
jgi:cytidylate kinase